MSKNGIDDTVLLFRGTMATYSGSNLKSSSFRECHTLAVDDLAGGRNWEPPNCIQHINWLAHWICDCILELIIFRLISMINIWKISKEISPDECHKMPLATSQHWFRKLLSTFKQQAITSINSSHPPLNKMAAISQTMLQRHLHERKVSILNRLSLTFVPLPIFQHLFRYWLCADQVTSHYAEPLHWRIHVPLG